MTTLPATTAESSSRPPRRRLRFSLRATLFLTTVIAVTLGLAHRRAERQRHAVEAIEALGGRVAYGWQVRANSSVMVKPVGPEWLRAFLGPHWFDHVIGLHFNATRRAPQSALAKSLVHAAKLPSVRSVEIIEQDIDRDEGRLLAQLESLEHLAGVSLTISPQGAQELAKAPRLRRVLLDDVALTTPAFAALADLPVLDDIYINSRDHESGGAATERYLLDDEGLRAFAGCKHLRALKLGKTRVTDKGVSALCELSTLEFLMLGSPHLTGQSLNSLAGIKRLKKLTMLKWRLRCDDLVMLNRCTSLKMLSLSPEVSVDCLPQLAALTQLDALHLCSRNLTDAALPQLATLKHLRTLGLEGTSVDPQSPAAQDLRRALPGCRILFPHAPRQPRLPPSQTPQQPSQTPQLQRGDRQ